MIDILDFIPKGRENAIKRSKLILLTGLSDRKIRELIADARRETVIINLQTGDGYYIPTTKEEIERFVKQEEHRLKSIGYSLKAARRALKEVS